MRELHFRLTFQSIVTVADIQKLSLAEKLQVMEDIWLELRERVDSAEVPEEHRKLLAERRRRVESGEARLLPWDEVKHLIERP